MARCEDADSDDTTDEGAAVELPQSSRCIFFPGLKSWENACLGSEGIAAFRAFLLEAVDIETRHKQNKVQPCLGPQAKAKVQLNN